MDSDESIRKYVNNFAKSRPWYKKLSFTGEQFVIFPHPGIQPINTLSLVDNSFIDQTDIYFKPITTWWIYEKAFLNEAGFSKQIKREIKRNAFTFNCFLNGTHFTKKSGDKVKGWQYIIKRDPNILFKLHGKYPDINDVIALVNIEKTQQIEKAVAAAKILRHTLAEYFDFDESIPELTLSSSDSLENDYQKDVIYVTLPTIRPTSVDLTRSSSTKAASKESLSGLSVSLPDLKAELAKSAPIITTTTPPKIEKSKTSTDLKKGENTLSVIHRLGEKISPKISRKHKAKKEEKANK